GQRALAVAGTVPAPGHDRRGDADAEEDRALGRQRLEGGGRHGQERRRAQLEGDDAGAEVEAGRGGGDRSERRERVGTGDLRGPEGAVAELGGAAGDVDRGGRPQGLERGECHTEPRHGPDPTQELPSELTKESAER